MTTHREQYLDSVQVVQRCLVAIIDAASAWQLGKQRGDLEAMCRYAEDIRALGESIFIQTRRLQDLVSRGA